MENYVRVHELLNGLDKNERKKILEYVEFKVRNFVRFIGREKINGEYSSHIVKNETGKIIKFNENINSWQIIVENDEISHKIFTDFGYNDRFINALALSLCYFKEALDKVTKVEYDGIKMDDIFSIKMLSAYERNIVHYALMLLAPVDEIAKDMKKDYDNIYEAYSYGEKELYWLRELYKNQLQETYKLSNKVTETLMDYVAMKYHSSINYNDDVVMQMLEMNYYYIDRDEQKKKEETSKAWNLGV